MKRNHILQVGLLLLLVSGLIWGNAGVPISRSFAAVDHESCRPDGMYTTPGVATPYCTVYDTAGRESMGTDHPRRVIGYFTGWRTGKNGQPQYLASQIPWSRITHINYAFAHIDGNNQISVGGAGANNAATGMEWPGVAGAEIDPAFSYKGHFNLLNKYKKLYPNVKTLVSVGGWAETGGYFDDTGNRVASGGFYTMTQSQASIDTFSNSVVAFLRQYGFNGVDIDYEYPTSNNNAGNPDDFTLANNLRGSLMKNYVALMKTLRDKLNQAGAQDGKYYMLTVAAPASGWLLRGMENFPVTQYLDYVNIMSYDLHGAWNKYVGPNAALYDAGNDGELAAGSVYSAYAGIGYLNTDWSYHYFRGAMPAGRINIGVPYYTRGWEQVSGGTNGLWGQSVGSNCPPGTNNACGAGALGIDNLWHDLSTLGAEVPAGASPMWHAKNLQQGIQGSYITQYGLDPVNNPKDRLTGTYTRYYDAALVAPWLWNATKKVFLSTEDEQSIQTKANYVRDKGLGGIMIWELAGDYGWDASRNGGAGEYYIGTTLTDIVYNTLKTAAPYGATKANQTLPTAKLDIKINWVEWPLGDNNYPISPKMQITNNSGIDLPPGTEFQFDYATTAPSDMSNQSGFTMSSISVGHTGNNIGGLRGDFHRASLKLPSFAGLANGATTLVAISYKLPVTQPSNYSVIIGGQSYGLVQDYARGGSSTPATATATGNATSNATSTPTGIRTATRTATAQPTSGTCTAPAWNATTAYNGTDLVSYNSRTWRAKWWTQGDVPGANSQNVWEDLGLCAGNPTATALPTATRTNTPLATTIRTNTPLATATRTNTPLATAIRTNTPLTTATKTNTPLATATKTNTPLATATKTNTPAPTATTSGVAAWAPNVAYTVNARVSYAGLTYTCLQAHTSLTGWEPPNVPALWQRN